jgi:hypothetical protein
MNSVGHYVPSALILPCKNWKNELTDNNPLGNLGIALETSWMTVEVFCNG